MSALIPERARGNTSTATRRMGSLWTAVILGTSTGIATPAAPPAIPSRRSSASPPRLYIPLSRHTQLPLHHRRDRRIPDHQSPRQPPPPVKQHVGPVRDDVFWFGRFYQIIINVEPPLIRIEGHGGLLLPMRRTGGHFHVGGIVTAREAPLRGTRDASTL